MAILWCGGEEIDFRAGVATPLTTATATNRRAAYSRVAMGASGTTSEICKGTPFPGGAVTSCWLSMQVVPSTYVNYRGVGLGRSGSNSGLFLGAASSSSTKATLWKFDGTTWTQLAQESGGTLGNTIRRLDMQVIGYGAAGTVNVYIDGTLLFTYSGDLSVSGITNLDSVYLVGASQAGGGPWYVSEVIVANEDTRLMSLYTLAPTGAGEANAWNGSYASIDEATTDDTDVVFTDTAERDAQFALSDLPAGTFMVKAAKVVARAAKGATGIGSLALGQKVGMSGIAGGGGFSGYSAGLSIPANYKRLRKVTPTETAQVAGLRALPWSPDGVAKNKALIYADNAGVPGALIAVSAEVVGMSTGVLIDFLFSSPPTVTSGTAYWVGLIGSTTSNWYRSGGGGADVVNADTYSDGPADPAGAMSTSDSNALDLLILKSAQVVNVGSTVALDVVWGTVERLMQQNPVTGSNWTAAEIDALQLNLRSKP